MKSIEAVHDAINNIAEDSRVNISKIDDYTFNITIAGELMDSFENLEKFKRKLRKVVLMNSHLKLFMAKDKMQN